MLISSVGLMARIKLKDVQVQSSQTGALPCFHAPRSRLIYGGYGGGGVTHNCDRNDVVHGTDTKRFAQQPRPSLRRRVRVAVTLDGLGGASQPGLREEPRRRNVTAEASSLALQTEASSVPHSAA